MDWIRYGLSLVVFVMACGRESVSGELLPHSLASTSGTLVLDGMEMEVEHRSASQLVLSFRKEGFQVWLEALRWPVLFSEMPCDDFPGNYAVRLRDEDHQSMCDLVEGDDPEHWLKEHTWLPSQPTLEIIKQTLQEEQHRILGHQRAVQLMFELMDFGIYAHQVTKERNGGQVGVGSEPQLQWNALTKIAKPQEFQQWIELYSKKVLNTNYDHTGTRAIVFSPDGFVGKPLWYPFHVEIRRNFGACPGEPGMALYQTCKDTPITYHEYQVGRRCNGTYALDHVCNDNTALQINDAYGVVGSNECQGTRRLFRPSCGVQWRQQQEKRDGYSGEL